MQNFLAIYDESLTGDMRYQTIARFPYTPEGEAECRDYQERFGAPGQHVVEETISDIFASPVDVALSNDDKRTRAVADSRVRFAWQVRIIWDEDTDEPGEILYGGFKSQADAQDFANDYPEDDFSDVLVEMVNLVVFS